VQTVTGGVSEKFSDAEQQKKN